MRRRAEAVAVRHRRWVALAVAFALAGGMASWVAVVRDQSTPVPLAAAVARFRADSRPPAVEARAGAPAVSTTAAPAASPGPVAAAGREPASSSPHAVRPAGGATGSRIRPTAGVYTYRTEGRDEISVLGAHHEYPSETHATVTHEAGCRWDVEHPLVEEHVEREERCTDGSAFRLVADGSEIEYFAQRDRGGFRCDPPLVLEAEGDRPGTRRTMTCPGDGNGDEADFTVTVHGREDVRIERRDVPAVHVTIEVRLRGRATGSARSDAWLHHRTGLPLRVVRRVDTSARALFGDVHYRERLRLELRSLTPTR